GLRGERRGPQAAAAGRRGGDGEGRQPGPAGGAAAGGGPAGPGGGAGGFGLPVSVERGAVLPLVQVRPGPPAPAGGEPQRRDAAGVRGHHREPVAAPVGGQGADETDLRDVLLPLRRLGDGAGSAGPPRQAPASRRPQLATSEPNSIGCV